jgi:cytochrome c peroxidase
MTFGRAALALLAAILGSVPAAGLAADKAPTAQQVASVPHGEDGQLAKMKAAYKRPKAIPFSAANPYSPQKVALGKLLYFDTRLSGSNLLSCASCHNPGFGWGDGQPLAIGQGMHVLGRRTPTIMNGAWGELFFWDGRAESLEVQALGPVQAAGEMNQNLDALVQELSRIDGYRKRFDEAFPGQGITGQNIAKAIATFERTIISSRAPFDEWIDGNEGAIPESAKRGFALFNTKARCAQCHNSWRFTDDSFHDVGLPDVSDPGRAKLLPDIEKMQHAFKTPGLRDLARRAPYMHNGSMATLEAVVDHYIQGGEQRPSLSEEMKPIALSAAERTDLLEFLNTLTGPLNPVVLPVLPR